VAGAFCVRPVEPISRPFSATLGPQVSKSTFGVSMTAERDPGFSPKPALGHARTAAVAATKLVWVAQRGERGSVRLGFFREVRLGC
jgi:hypothetical protein